MREIKLIKRSGLALDALLIDTVASLRTRISPTSSVAVMEDVGRKKRATISLQ